MKALLIVDIQNDFLPGGTLPVPNGDEIISKVNELQEGFDLVLASKDWHPLNHVSFAKTHGKKPGETVDIKGMKQSLWPVHCVQMSVGAEFPKALKTDKIRKVFYKGSDPNVDSFSAFFDNAHLHSTGLDAYLKEQGIDELYVVGLATDYCVKYSVLDALEQGFQVTVILEAIRGIDLKKGDSKKALEEMEKKGAHLIEKAKL